jgi:hypothetical protein
MQSGLTLAAGAIIVFDAMNSDTQTLPASPSDGAPALVLPDSPVIRAAARMLQTVKLLRGRAPDSAEAEFYLREEKRLERITRKPLKAA